jgi:hypothetical protein
MKPVIIITIVFVLLIPITIFAQSSETSHWSNILFVWHEKNIISSTDFINALGFLYENKIGGIEDGKRNISSSGEGYDYNHPAFKNNEGGYDWEVQDRTIFMHSFDDGREYKITKDHNGILVGYIDEKYLASYDGCPWC